MGSRMLRPQHGNPSRTFRSLTRDVAEHVTDVGIRLVPPPTLGGRDGNTVPVRLPRRQAVTVLHPHAVPAEVRGRPPGNRPSRYVYDRDAVPDSHARTGSTIVQFVYHRCEWMRATAGEDELVGVNSTFVVAPMRHEERTTVDSVVVHRRHQKDQTPVWTCAKDSSRSRHCDHIKRVKAFLKTDDRTKDLFPDVETEDVAASIAAGECATSPTSCSVH